ncbi:hypothetical protein BKA63DRAFT_35083 [Paraphoma chrysanthemicola]|nr:hypothetical protein BKA63DRAFT_35083 [Paraphoma chrysanthemicola]
MAMAKLPPLRYLSPLSSQRYISYLIIAFVVSLSFNCLVIEGHGILLATLFPIAAAIVTNHLVHDCYQVPVSYCLAVSVTTCLLGHVAHGMHVHITNPGKRLTALRPASLHFLLAFVLLSEIEWYRLRFDQKISDTLYPDFVSVFPVLRYSASFDEYQSRRYPGVLGTIIRDWRYILADVGLAFFFFLGHCWLHRTILNAMVFDCAEHAGLEPPYIYESEFWRASWIWPALLEILLVRPIRLLGGLIAAWVGALLDSYVSRWTDPVSLTFHR